MMDIRSAPLGAQIEAYRKGLIPYIPGHQDDSEAMLNLIQESALEPPDRQRRKSRSTKPKAPPQPASPEALQSLYVLEVALLNDPLTEKFVKKNPQVIRTIEIRGDQTLADLHAIIFKAFDREEEHFYEFQLKGNGPNDPDADRYGLPSPLQGGSDNELTGEVGSTQIGALGLSVGEPFGYWFDFGDDWWHQVSVVTIAQPQPKTSYPRITERIGASPPQYAEF